MIAGKAKSERMVKRMVKLFQVAIVANEEIERIMKKLVSEPNRLPSVHYIAFAPKDLCLRNCFYFGITAKYITPMNAILN
jgi:hypothetical protein